MLAPRKKYLGASWLLAFLPNFEPWTPDSNSEIDFDGFDTVEFGGNRHFAAALDVD